MREFFSDMYTGNLAELLEVHLTAFWAPVWLSLLEALNSRTCPSSASSTSSITGQVFLLLPWLPPVASAQASLLKEAMTSCICLLASLVLGAAVCSVSAPLLVSKKSCWFFSLFSFSLVRTEWWHASCLCAELETRSLLVQLLGTGDFSVF